MKNDANPSSTAVAYGVTSRRRLRVIVSTTLDQIVSRNAHSSSDPSWEDQAAAAL